MWRGLGEGTRAEGGKLAESTCSQGVPESGSAGGKGHLETRPPQGPCGLQRPALCLSDHCLPEAPAGAAPGGAGRGAGAPLPGPAGL